MITASEYENEYKVKIEKINIDTTLNTDNISIHLIAVSAIVLFNFVEKSIRQRISANNGLYRMQIFVEFFSALFITQKHK